MQIVQHPHPVLRYQSVDLQRIDDNLRKIVRRMFDLMYEANGIGLAANQVGLPFRFFVVNLAARPGSSDEELVFINPILRKFKGDVVGEEGCLSLPGLYGDVHRASSVKIDAFDLSGQGFTMDLNGLPARVVQHETDHLDGMMFTDRMHEARESEGIDGELAKFEQNFRAAQAAQLFASDEELLQKVQKMATVGVIPSNFAETPVHKLDPPDLSEE